MREIKFRAYWKDYNEMHYLKHLNLECCYKDEDVVLMQYTGLKDKNGVEIYEGDIVKNEFETVGVIEYNTEPYSAEFVVKQINNKEENYSEKSFYSPVGMNTCFDEIEVIGNTYENPELLEAKDDTTK